MTVDVTDDATCFSDEQGTSGNAGQYRLILPEDIVMAACDQEQWEGRGNGRTDEQGTAKHGSHRITKTPIGECLSGFSLACRDNRYGEIGLVRGMEWSPIEIGTPPRIAV